MKVIFLDIDGVLNTEVFARAFFGVLKRMNKSRTEAKAIAKAELRDEYGITFDPMATDMLEWIVQATDAKIVISSTWRKSGLNTMQTMWEMRDLPGEVIDITPRLNTPRGEEIAEWLRENQVDSYVILDDGSDMLPEQAQYFVKTNPAYGITYQDALSAVAILNNLN
jgi:hypothetical protein